MEIEKKYSNGEITILWKPALCIHSTKCWKGDEGLIAVFDPHKRPWIDPLGADTDTIITQVNKCPSGALTYFRNDQESTLPDKQSTAITVEALARGPLMIHGDIMVKDSSGKQSERKSSTAFCRCGASANKPYCDGSHHKINFTD